MKENPASGIAMRMKGPLRAASGSPLPAAVRLMSAGIPLQMPAKPSARPGVGQPPVRAA